MSPPKSARTAAGPLRPAPRLSVRAALDDRRAAAALGAIRSPTGAAGDCGAQPGGAPRACARAVARDCLAGRGTRRVRLVREE